MSEQLFHVGIKAVIINDAGELLLVREAKHDTAYWDVPGGRVEPGENFMATLSRELREEIAVDFRDTPTHFATVLSNKQIPTKNGQVSLVLVAYSVRLAAGSRPKPSEAGIELQWLPYAKAAALLADKYPEDFCAAILNLGAEA